MRTDHIGLAVGGQLNIWYIDLQDAETYTEEADNENRVKSMLEAFV